MMHLLISLEDDEMSFEEVEHFGELIRHLCELGKRYIPEWGLSAINPPDGTLENWEDDADSVMLHARRIFEACMDEDTAKVTG
jgi:hypothetical protein